MVGKTLSHRMPPMSRAARARRAVGWAGQAEMAVGQDNIAKPWVEAGPALCGDFFFHFVIFSENHRNLKKS
jgi:hypothetical protein